VTEPAAGGHWDTPDVLIVGAGASGGAVAWSLAEAGFRVVCLEQGDWVPAESLPHGRDDWEIHPTGSSSPFYDL
jgi:choline dehydrogenase-like flavoprotein